MKYCIDKYPKGSLKGQKSAGRYIDEYKYENLKILAQHIADDNTFLAIYFSSTFEVGAGKTTAATQDGECYTELVNKLHGTNLTFTMKNIVFRPKDLIERAFQLPKYSCILLDEWEDAHYWSQLGVTLRQFFRKCRQLNLFIIIIIPNFFQLPMGYAVSRSIYACDVRYEGEFERGYFRFYNFDRKKELYLKGKRECNYDVVHCNFQGRFTSGYAIDETEYRKAKYLDMLRAEQEERHPNEERRIKIRLFKQLHQSFPEISIKKLSESFGVSDDTGYNWLKVDENEGEIEISQGIKDIPMSINRQYYNGISVNDTSGGEQPIVEEKE